MTTADGLLPGGRLHHGRATSSRSRCSSAASRSSRARRRPSRATRSPPSACSIAVVATLLNPELDGADFLLIAIGLIIGTIVGVPSARNVKMTAMPQMVALFNGVGGGAVALIAWAEFRELRRRPERRARRRHPARVRGDHRLDLLLGLEHRLRQAAGADLRQPGEDPRRPVREHRAAGDGDRRRRRDPARLGERGPVRPHPRRGRDPRQPRRAADRRRRHARRHLDPERLHRPQRRGRRHRAGQLRADRRRHDRRRLRHDPHRPDGQGDEPLDRLGAARRLRRRGARGRGRRRRDAAARCARRAPPTSRSCSPTRARSSSCRATAWPSRRPSTRSARWPRRWRRRASRSSSRSTRSRAACRAT